MTLKLNRVLDILKVHVRAIYHQADCSDSWVSVIANFLPYLAMIKKSKNTVLWSRPLTLKFPGFRAVLKIHVPATFHQAKYSGSW